MYTGIDTLFDFMFVQQDTQLSVRWISSWFSLCSFPCTHSCSITFGHKLQHWMLWRIGLQQESRSLICLYHRMQCTKCLSICLSIRDIETLVCSKYHHQICIHRLCRKVQQRCPNHDRCICKLLEESCHLAGRVGHLTLNNPCLDTKGLSYPFSDLLDTHSIRLQGKSMTLNARSQRWILFLTQMAHTYKMPLMVFVIGNGRRAVIARGNMSTILAYHSCCISLFGSDDDDAFATTKHLRYSLFDQPRKTTSFPWTHITQKYFLLLLLKLNIIHKRECSYLGKESYTSFWTWA